MEISYGVQPETERVPRSAIAVEDILGCVASSWRWEASSLSFDYVMTYDPINVVYSTPIRITFDWIVSMTLNGQEIWYFMSVGVSSIQIPDQSFEELRIQDYLKSYGSTSRPPLPCPQSPDTPNARAALGLGPLFVPTAIPVSPDSLSDTGSSASLPVNHEFSTTKTILGEHFESISAQSLYSHFSHEELRYHAYLSGNKIPPISPTVDTMEGGATSSAAHPFYANDSKSTAYMASTAVPGTPDYMMSIVASHKYEKHSFEELRLASLLAGKEVGSSEIPTRGALPAQLAPTLFGRPRGDAFSSGSLKLF